MVIVVVVFCIFLIYGISRGRMKNKGGRDDPGSATNKYIIEHKRGVLLWVL